MYGGMKTKELNEGRIEGEMKGWEVFSVKETVRRTKWRIKRKNNA